MYVLCIVCIMGVCMYVFVNVCMYVSMYICMFLCMYVCMYVCTYVCIYVLILNYYFSNIWKSRLINIHTYKNIINYSHSYILIKYFQLKKYSFVTWIWNPGHNFKFRSRSEIQITIWALDYTLKFILHIQFKINAP